MEQTEPDKGWFWGRAFILLLACSGAVVGLNMFLYGADALSSLSGAGEVVGSSLAVWALGGIAPVVAHFAKKSPRKTLLKAWITGCCVAFGLITFGQTYVPLIDKVSSVIKTEDVLKTTKDNDREVGRDVNDSKIREYRQLAEQGDAVSQFNLGVMYADGTGVIQDYKEAAKWYRKAAEQGETVAQNNLGLLYRNGQGVIQDYKEAIKWYRKAAEHGEALGQANLGAMYEYGYAVDRDYVQAHMWYNIAAANGFEEGGQARDRIAEIMTSDNIIKAQSLAREWMQKHKK